MIMINGIGVSHLSSLLPASSYDGALSKGGGGEGGGGFGALWVWH